MTFGGPQFKNCLAILIILQFSPINEKTTHIHSIINFIITHSYKYDSQMILNICLQQQKEKKKKTKGKKKKPKKKRKKEGNTGNAGKIRKY